MSGRTIGFGFLVLVILGIVARIFYPTSTPVVSVAAEDLFFGLTNAMLITLVIDGILIGLAYAATRNMQIVPRGLQNVMEAIIEALYKLFKNINAQHVGSTFPIVATIFLFVIVSNYLGLFPGAGSIGICKAKEDHAGMQIQVASAAPSDVWSSLGFYAEDGEIVYANCPPDKQSIVPYLRPPTTDLNHTIALALISFVWIQYLAFKTLGLGYLKKYFITPFGKLSEGKGPIMTIVGLLEIISVFARLPAFAFRLFGNIFAGEVLIIVMIFLLPLGLPLPIYAFEVFVGFIQAFIFAVLVMAFISIDATPHGDEHAH